LPAGSVCYTPAMADQPMEESLKQALALGRGYYLKKEYARAERYLSQVVEQNQSFADVYNMLGVIYHDQGQYQKAQRSFEAALRLNPSYTDAALNLAVIYNDTGKYQQAQEIYHQALTHSGAAPGQLDRYVKGKLANMYAEIGDVFQSAGLYAEAIAEYQRALDLGPTFIDIRLRAASACRDAGRRDEAIQQYEEIVRQNPGFIPARLSLGLALLGAERRPEAVAQWEEVLRLVPGNRNAEMYLKLASGEPG